MKNKKQFMYRLAMILGIFLASFAITALADWTAPSAAPTDGNPAAPINVGIDLQTRTGPLSINNLVTIGNSFGGPISLLVPNGAVGIGTPTDSNYKLDVRGGPINAGGGLIIQTCTSASCPTSANAQTGRMWLQTN